MNIKNCPSFQNGQSHHSHGLRKTVADPHLYSKCNLKDKYNKNIIKMNAESRHDTKVQRNRPGKSRSEIKFTGVDYEYSVI